MNNIKEVLIIGQEVKNYKMLCGLLNEDVKGGTAKTLQLKDWERYMSWDKNGISFIITDIYNEVLPKPDSKVALGNNNIYAKYIEILIMDLLSKQEDYPFFCSRNWLMANLGIVNFKYISTQQRELVKNIGKFEENALNEWFSRAWQKTDQILLSALKNLNRRCLLEYSKEYTIVEYESSTSKREISRPANDEDITKYLTAKRNALTAMTKLRENNKYPKVFDSMKNLYPNYYNEYYSTLFSIMKKDYKWINVYTQYKLIYNKEHLIEALPDTEIQLHKLELNNKVMDAMHNDANTKVKNALQKFKDEYAILLETWFGIPEESACNSYKFLKPDNYVDIQDEISEVFIRLPKGKIDN